MDGAIRILPSARIFPLASRSGLSPRAQPFEHSALRTGDHSGPSTQCELELPTGDGTLSYQPTTVKSER